MRKKTNSKGFFIALAVATLLPFSFYLLAKYLGKDVINLPKNFIAVGVDANNDSIYTTTPELILQNQMGDTVGINKNLKGKIVVLNFFFTSCKTICPKLTSNMKMLQHAYRKFAKMNSDMDTMLHFVSISIDEGDSTAALRNYAANYGVDNDRWWLCRGARNEVISYARDELRLKAPTVGRDADAMMHSQMFVLLDKQRHIRGYYDGLDSVEVKRCADDIGWLGLEKVKKEH